MTPHRSMIPCSAYSSRALIAPTPNRFPCRSIHTQMSLRTSTSSSAQWQKPNGPHQLRDGASGRIRIGDDSASLPSWFGAPISHVSCM